MESTDLRQPSARYLCGLANWHPQFMQRYATTKSFMTIYGLLGIIQSMSYVYFAVTLSTIEKRFKLQSQTTGIILSGNEISQILFSLILSYIGGQRNRPRWIAWGSVFCGLSCYILALPHFIYGAGEDALKLTKEYAEKHAVNGTNATTSFIVHPQTNSHHLCGSLKLDSKCDTLLTVMPSILIFLSQFVLGIGNTLYYTLGQTYLDDSTKKTNTPMLFAIAMAVRSIGPIVGFPLAYISLAMYIDPLKTPIIDSKDPRWLGAWWFGWTILGTLMIIFSGLVGLFPKEMPKKTNNEKEKYNSHFPQVLRLEQIDEGLPLNTSPPVASDFLTLKDFSKALMRLLRNKLLMYNIISGIFYILGAASFLTFMSRYIEVQFHKSAHSGSIVIGPAMIFGLIVGILGSGIVISKKKPHPSKLLMWNVIVGGVYIVGQILYMFMYCGDTISLTDNGKLDLTFDCNANCSCDNVPYTPVCHESSDTTFFSSCHAGCSAYNTKEQFFSNCSCVAKTLKNSSTSLPSFTFAINSTESIITTAKESVMDDGITTTKFYDFNSTSTESTVDLLLSREKGFMLTNSPALSDILDDELKPGVCLKNCKHAFWAFAITGLILHCFGSSGRLGNILVNFRAVSTEDKSFAQGLGVMMISLFALIPGPIIFGRIIDSTCLLWTKTCSGIGNCQLYDQTRYRYLVNGVACVLTALGVIFDILVWYHGRNLDIYGEKEVQRSRAIRKRKKPIPLLAHK